MSAVPVHTAAASRLLPQADYSQYRRSSDIQVRHLLTVVFVLSFIYYSTGSGEAEYCDERVCLFVYLSITLSTRISETARLMFTKLSVFVHVIGRLPMAVARSSSAGVAIRYILPVL